MWCPNCKNEYREGFTECAECHVPLVEELTEDMLTSLSEEEVMDADFVDWANKHPEQIALMQEQQAMLLKIEEAKADMVEDMAAEEAAEEGPKKGEVYQSKTLRASEHYSSAVTLLGVGAIGLIAVILAATGVIPLNLAPNAKYLSFSVMGIMFVIFIIVGFVSFQSYKTLKLEGIKEDQLTDTLITWFMDNHRAESIDEIAKITEDAKKDEVDCYFRRMESIRSLIANKAEEELEPAYLEHLAESLYNSLYESELAFPEDFAEESETVLDAEETGE